MSSSTSSGHAQSSSADAKSYGDDKPHPSEFLEFVTLPTHQFEIQEPSHQHTEDVSFGKTATSELRPSKSADDLFVGLTSTVPNFASLSADAKEATKAEHKMTFAQGVRLYPKAIGWSVLLSFTIVMEGYDTTLINSFYAFPIFRKSYGTPTGNHNWQISAAWQSGLTNGAVAGEIIGLIFNGYLTDRFGYQKTMMGALIWLCVFVFLAFFSFNIEMLLGAEIMCGLSWGIFQTLSTTYAAEVMPTILRAYLVSTALFLWHYIANYAADKQRQHVLVGWSNNICGDSTRPSPQYLRVGISNPLWLAVGICCANPHWH